MESIAVRGLFSGKALIEIDGKSRVMREGERSPEGVLLIHADSEYAEIEVNGKRQKLILGSSISSRFAAAKKRVVTIPRGADGMYRVTGTINRRRVEFLVDTGATVLALNKNMARQLGINYLKRGKKGYTETASGVVPVHMVTLDRVEVGSIALSNVEAVILDGEHPSIPLLGLSFLRRIELTQAGNLLKLSQ
ncbi:MAG: TIGR02281 family clan AA aspartic protease [Gammaproteobacteria bacterium]|nr:TIGR02281 family clan AA aspartic protease [Gammaproteobacteria bacterium]